jgi:MSHA pilin protein MshA
MLAVMAGIHRRHQATIERTSDWRGFTLMEVVAVVTILAILAVFAVPRFLAIKAQSRAAAVDALADSVRSGAALAHTLWLARGRPRLVTLQGRNVAIVNGYPDLATVDATVADASGFTYSSATGVFAKMDVAGRCTVTYIPAAADSAPSIAVETSGCNP